MPLSHYLVEQVMDADIYCVKEDDPIKDVMHNMHTKGLSYAIVITRDGSYKGILHRATLVEAAIYNEPHLTDAKCSEYVTELAPTVHPKDTLERAAKMIETSIGEVVPVVDARIPVGIVKERHILDILDGSA